MAATAHLQIDLPSDLYARLQEAAARSGRSPEAVLVESLDLLFGEPPRDWMDVEMHVDRLSDAQLWALVYRRLPWLASARLRELTQQGQQSVLTAAEQAELARLIDEADHLTLLRSRAAAALQERGYDVRGPLRLAAGA